mmetsp:Transcript_16722/g.38824  ORF Transcript_16722/g.38824 Transcript_16722/m.38824 type:complete len:220 (-) Transcript_16722:394-1053(-)
MPQEEFPEAVVVLANEDSHLASSVAPAHLAFYPECSAQRIDLALHDLPLRGKPAVIEQDALEELPPGRRRDAFVIVVPLGRLGRAVDDPAAVSVEELRERGHDARGVRTAHEQLGPPGVPPGAGGGGGEETRQVLGPGERARDYIVRRSRDRRRAEGPSYSIRTLAMSLGQDGRLDVIDVSLVKLTDCLGMPSQEDREHHLAHLGCVLYSSSSLGEIKY